MMFFVANTKFVRSYVISHFIYIPDRLKLSWIVLPTKSSESSITKTRTYKHCIVKEIISQEENLTQNIEKSKPTTMDQVGMYMSSWFMRIIREGIELANDDLVGATDPLDREQQSIGLLPLILLLTFTVLLWYLTRDHRRASFEMRRLARPY